RARWALPAGFLLGLGFFNKIDFGIMLAGTALAAIFAGGKPAVEVLRRSRRMLLAGFLGFLVGGGAALSSLGIIAHQLFIQNMTLNGAEYVEKLQTLRAMYDGSYFYRLMDAGGVFGKMYSTASPVWTPFGIIVLIAAAILIAEVFFSPKETSGRP